ncbi:ABC transporter permease subunit [uncultured Cytophaga sp.]|uniref:ABC transporter permease subunit n=1 Tax=uncultured Cytophaga sp. TaxID=160238 RepID=UPI00262AF9CF|nr:ABC transporter permease subunit [uncultured Cytophaga sp.]
MNRILKYVFLDIFQNKIVILYTLILALFAWSTLSLEDNNSKGLLTLLNIILLAVPLVSILFSTIYVYNSNEFIELLVSHPLKRSKIWISLFLGLSLSLIFAFVIGAGIPILLFSEWDKAYMMILVGMFITVIFVAIAFLSTIITRDKAKGIGISILLWLYFSLLFDGLVLFLLFQFADYPIEKYMVVLTSLNPIDLSRVLILLELDVSAMMGYTGAIFKLYFGSNGGLIVSFLLLFSWIALPFGLSLIKFRKKDL